MATRQTIRGHAAWRGALIGLATATTGPTLAPTQALAQPGASPMLVASASSPLAGVLEVPLHKSDVVRADRPIAKAMIGNEKIADILPITDRSIYVLGKEMGTTSLTLYDGAGRVISVLDVAVGPDVETLTTQMHALIPNEHIEAKISNDAVVLTGTVNNPLAVDRAMQLAKTYAGDKVVNMLSIGSSQQVMLEVRFAEVSRNIGKDVGVSTSVTSRSGRFSAVTGQSSQMVPQAITSTNSNESVTSNSLTSNSTSGITGFNNLLGLTAITGAYGIFSQAFTVGGVNIQGILNGLESRGLAKTLAQPTLVALSGEKASFLAGGEFPIPVAQSAATGSVGGSGTAITVEFKQFGVSLGFTPTVLGDSTINLIVEPEVSQLDPTASITLNGISIPGLKTRRASTTLELRDGESFAIAGLLQKDFKTSIDQMPVLGSIPILGALFRSTSFQKGETELLIVVTAHLVAPIKPGQVALPTDRVKDPSEAESFLLGQPYHPQPLPQSSAAPQPGGPVSATPAAPPSAQNGSAPKTKGDGYAY